MVEDLIDDELEDKARDEVVRYVVGLIDDEGITEEIFVNVALFRTEDVEIGGQLLVDGGRLDDSPVRDPFPGVGDADTAPALEHFGQTVLVTVSHTVET